VNNLVGGPGPNILNEYPVLSTGALNEKKEITATPA
jgi:hypothetical protein